MKSRLGSIISIYSEISVNYPPPPPVAPALIRDKARNHGKISLLSSTRLIVPTIFRYRPPGDIGGFTTSQPAAILTDSSE